MSRERIQEQFSDLFEGTIDPGLGQQIKARLDSDYDLQSDYKQFAETMALLDTLKDEEIEVPTNLSSMIADRLEANEKKPAFSFGLIWRNLGIGALACVAIAGAFFAIQNRNAAQAVQSSVTPGVGPTHTVEAPRKVLDTIEVKMMNTRPVLTFNSSGPKSLKIMNQEDQSLIRKYELNGNELSNPLENTGEQPCVFQVEATGEATDHYVVLPGSATDYEAAGHGNLITFAKLLATKYRTVVHLQLPKDAETDVTWDVNQTSASEAAKAVLSSSEYTITASDGIVVIQKQSH
ncbi:MAG: hypothetical protein JST12_01980 [Armatimonadetes bacterium]|nr:hypothetical protein [Armatimonadota bacterium]MBS1700404.1 hypothetical protein [Armatimonadota bacterium]MBS1725334.1 hypothetical protein [Armatimonadota bacterium]